MTGGTDKAWAGVAAVPGVAGMEGWGDKDGGVIDGDGR